MARCQILFSIHSSKGEFKNQHSTKKYQQQSEEVGDKFCETTHCETKFSSHQLNSKKNDEA